MRRFLVAIALIFGIVSFGATAAYSIPFGYTELQYIVTNNDAYIVTDLYVNDFDRVTSRLTMYDNSMGLTNGDGAVGAVLFGTTASSTAGAQGGRCFKLYVTSGSGGMTAGYNGTWGGSWSTSLAGKRVPLETPVDIDVKLASGSQWVKIDGTVYGSNSQTAGTLSNTYPVTLFALNYAGTPKGIPHLACESMIFYSGNTVVSNLVPARRNSDNAVGMYDTVSNTFYASSTSSPFIAGPSSTATISYVMNGGTNYSGAPTSYYIGVGATIDGTPTKSGNAFAGWCTDSALTNCAMTQTISTSDTGDKTFYAKWGDIYSITYELNGGTNYANAPTNYVTGVGATIDGTPTKSGKAFAGWCTDSALQNCLTTQTISTSDTGDKTFYAKWGDYTITYKNGGGTGSDVVQAVLPNGTFTTQPGTIFTKPNSVITAWNTTSGGSYSGLNTQYTYDTSGETVLTANWRACVCLNGTNVTNCIVTGVTDNKCQYRYTCADGYTHNGNSSGTFEGSVNTPVNSSVNCETGVSITLDWDENGGGAISNGVCSYGGNLTLPNAPVYSGYTFNGWKLADDTYAAAGSTINNGCVTSRVGVMGGTSTVIQAQWCQNCVQPQHGSCSLDATTPGTCSYTTTCDANYTLSGDGTATPTCSGNEYDINYVLGYGDYVNPRPAYDNAVVPDGYTPTEYIEQTATVKNDTSTIKLDFSGYGTWIIDAQGTGIGATNYNPILVSYEPNTNQTGWFGANPSRYWGAGDNLANFLTRSIINTTFSAGRQDVVINGTITQTYTGSVVTLANWRLFNHSTNPMLVKVFSAKFTQNDELKFNGIPVRRDSDNVCGLYDTVRGIFFTSSAKTNFTCPNAREPDKYTAGTGKEITFVPTRPGSEFLGWCTDSALTNCSMNPVISTNATGDKTFYAKWSVYNISYVINGGTNYSGAPIEYTYGTGATINGTPTKTGNAFAGWCTDSELTNCAMSQTISASDMGNKTFYAKWIVLQAYNINYVLNGGGQITSYGPIKSGYESIEYIESDGTQWISTNVAPTSNFALYVDGMILNGNTNGTSYFFGTVGDTLNAKVYSNTKVSSCISSNCTSGGISTGGLNNRFYIGISPHWIQHYTGTQSTLERAYSGTGKLTLLGVASGSSKGLARFYGVKLYNGSTPTFLGTPVIRESDDVCGLYDTVNDVFYPSTNGELFICGNTTTYTQTYFGGQEMEINTVPKRDNSTFVGWCTDSALTNCSLNPVIPANSTGEKTFYAKWACNTGYTVNAGGTACESNTITIVYDNGGHGTTPASTTCVYGEDLTLPAALTDTSYNFYKWTANGKKFSAESTIECNEANLGTGTGTATITAAWDDCLMVSGTCYPVKFTVTTTKITASTAFKFQMSAKGTFYVDWGDGSAIQTISRTGTTTGTYTHTFAARDEPYTIKFAGTATGYNTVNSASTSNIGPLRFYGGTPALVGAVSGSLGRLFPKVGSTQPRFYTTFYQCSNLKSIPEDIFEGLSGAVTSYMFYYTFGGTGITSVPENLFAGLSGAPNTGTFWGTFAHCPSLATIPAGLFRTITGAPATSIFQTTFYNCPSLTAIPEGLFNNLSGAPATKMFQTTFYNNTSLTSIPENLFSKISGAPATYMFYGTFQNCSGITSIPVNLFNKISGAPKDYMFWGTFSGCSGLTGAIPENLFSKISGAPATYMFYGTFQDCSGITSIPANLFSKISGAPATFMFSNTFSGCSGLTGSIPGTLFSGITGAPAESMFAGTFNGCSNLSGYIDPEMFKNISGAAATNMMTDIFAGTGLDTTCPPQTEQYMTGFESYWSSKVACGPEVDTSDMGDEKFTVTVDMPANTAFKFHMSAIGDFYVDWGDGTGESIGRAGTSEAEYSHTYTNAGTYQIKFYGTATGYSTTATVPAIRFFNGTRANHYSAVTAAGTEQYITGISGSLGALFPTIGTGATNGQQPRFYQTFTGATHLTGTLPANLFSGITGAPATYMFDSTFAYCTSLTTAIPETLFSGLSGAPAGAMFYFTFANSGFTGSIPATLFSGISGAPASSMFYSTFKNCSGLTGEIPATLFSGISGAAATYMFDGTFAGCSGLTGSIPSKLFGTLSGAPKNYMFRDTFNGCSGLTGSIPANLFAGIGGTGTTTVDQFVGMYQRTFKGCSGLTGSIPNGLLRGYGAKSDYMFQETFYGCSGLSGYIPFDLVPTLSSPVANSIQPGYVYLYGANQTDMYTDMFTGTNLATTECPEGTLKYTTGIESQISPYVMCVDLAALYGNEPKFTITTTEMAASTAFSFNLRHTGTIFVDWGDGTATRYNRGTLNTTAMTASHTYATAGSYQIKFYGAATGYSGTESHTAIYFGGNTNIAGISGSLGALFPRVAAGESGSPRFYQTFLNCTNLQGPIPENLFVGTLGTPVKSQYREVFKGCTGLTNNFVPPNLFKGLSGTASNYMTNIFADSGLLTECPTGYSQYITGLESNWSSKVSCVPDTPASELGNPKFTVTTSNLDADTTFKFKLSAAGDFYVDWGDGSAVQHIADPRTTAREYTHTYTTAGSYQIKFWGTATAYSTSYNTAAISFYSGTPQLVGEIGGSLAALFPTIGTGETNGQQPRFYQTFMNCTNLTGSIPATLFSGFTGSPATYMFNGTFSDCSGLTGSIPSTLFSGFSGSPVANMFSSTFVRCSGLTGPIPATLFSGISGAPASSMFASTFYGCTGLTSIPSGLFSGISGTPASNMYYQTFYGCSGLTGAIPNRFFGNLSGSGEDYSFNSTFYGCTGLTGSIPDDLFSGVTSGSYTTTFNSTFQNCSGLSGYVSPQLFADYTGAKASSMSNIFNGSGLMTECPTGTTQYTTGFESYWNSKVSCTDGFVTPFVLNDSDATTTSVPTTIYSKWGIGWCTNSSDCESMTMPEYMQLYIPQEYIYTSNSSPYIDTGYTFTDNRTPRIVIDGSFSGGSGWRLHGVSSSYGGPAVGVSNNGYFSITTNSDISSNVSFNTSRNIFDLNIPAGTFTVTYASSGTKYVDMSGLTTTNTNVTKPTFKLFGYATGTSAVTTSSANRYIYSAKLYDNGVLVRDYIPVKRKSDNKCGLYDMVNNTFVSSATSTELSCSGTGTWGNLPTSQLTTLPTKTDKVFNGYWTGENGTGTKVVDAEGNIISNETTTKLAKANDTGKTLYADWLDSYSVTYSCGDGTGTPPAAASITAKREFTPAANTCSRMGYMFNGWAISGTSTVNKVTPFTWNYTENKTFTASWTPAKFTITTIDMPANTTFNFKMSAKGTFWVDWGDGSPVETITRSSAASGTTYSHTYTTGGVKQIMFDGLATGYYSSSSYNSDAYSAISFYNNTNIAQVSGSLGSIFPSLSTTSTDTSYQPRFMFTFNDCTNLTDIPSNLFSGITKPATGMFNYTFAGTSSLYKIPVGLFSSIVGEPQIYLFRSTFNGSGITGSIPGDLFSGISGNPQTYMFSATFANCSNLTGEIPSTLFSGISGTPAEAMYDVTFANCSGLTGSIPSGLFGNISGTAQPYAFTGVFLGCSNLTGTIPENLFGSMTSASTQEFRQAFQNCSKLEGWVPPRLFASVSGTGSLFMDEIFKGSGIVTECPSGYTQYITGFESYWNSKVSCTDGFVTPITLNDSSATTAAAPSTVYLKYGDGWYSDDTATNSLTQLTTLPTKTDWVFDGYWTSSNGGGTQVIDNTGAPIVNDTATKIAKITETGKTLYANWVKNYNVTYDCGEGTGTAPAAVVATSGKTFTPAANTCTREGYMFTGWAISGVSTGTNITNTMAPFTWNYTENKTFTAQWTEGPKFTITTTDMADNTSFYVGISAAGTFYIDWGDGKIQKITQSSTNSGVSSYSHTYATGGVKTINFAGLATGYYRYNSISTSYSPISFYNNTNIAQLAGSLGAIFPTLSGTSSYTTNPRFMYTFSGCTNLTEIPATLFSGVTRPYNHTFYGTFQSSGLTSIPATLFSNIQGAPAEYMFAQTFSGCTGLTSLPTGLFSGISGAPAGGMFRQTFENCSGLTGSIPSRFFGNLSGTLISNYYYFNQTFNGCTNLSGYVPTDLFAGLSYASSSTNNILNDVFGGTNLETSCPVDMQQYITGFEDYFDGKVACTTAKTPAQMGDEKFTITTTNMGAGSEFPISISAAGEFLIDCGNTIKGEPQYIYIADGRTTQRTYYCDYPTAGSYQIKLYGTATGYDPNTYSYDSQYYPAIGFGNTAQIAGIAGSLGALFPTIGNGDTNGQQPRFNGTFNGAENMTGTIPENLFNGIIGTPTKYMFNNTFGGCSKLSGSIPENLFAGLTGSVSDYDGHYFYRTFNGCSGLTGYVPANLFRMSTSYMVNYNNMGDIFYGSGLLDKCPAGTMTYYTGFESYWNLNSNGNKKAVSCEPGIDENDAMFGIGTTELDDGDTFSFSLSAAGTFYVDWGDDTVDKIERNNTTPSTYSHTYENLKGGESFAITFVNDGVTAYSSDLTTPAISFAGNTKIGTIFGSLAELMPTITVAGKPQQPRFYQTFKDCTNLEYIEDFDRLFDRIDSQYHATKPIINGQPVSHMFEGLFMGCTALETEIPESLFAAISGTPTIGLFAHTFEGCTGLYDEIPGNLFATISGAPAISMFEGTFKGCTGLEGNIPEKLFAGISGNPAERMFMETFDGCSNLEGYIYPNTFAEISTVNVANMMTNVFRGSGLDTECPSGMQQYTTGFEEWFTGKVSCDEHQPAEVPDMNYNTFFIHLSSTEASATFSFDLSATGEFEVNWGDGNTDYITRTDTTPTTYSHTYTKWGHYDVVLSSAVTGYSTNETTPAISFAHTSNTSSIGYITTYGSLIETFPVLGTANGQIPRFYHTFYGLTNLYGFHSSEIFNPNYNSNENDPQITNLPFASHMFDGMFANCTNLFDNDWWGNNEDTENFRDMFYAFGGTPAAYTFANMFSGTTNATGYISPYMFNNITGTATNMMQNIFANSGLDTECPSGTNQYITGFESNWSGKVSCQTSDDLPSIYLYTTNMNAGSVFNFSLSATGRFAVNWGDGSDVQWIDRNNTTPTTYSHTYTSGGNYYVYIYGLATGYSTNETTAAISFANNTFIRSINDSRDGSLGLMFPTIGDGTTNGQQPRFYRMFYNCTNLNDSYVSFTGNSDLEGVSSGIHGTPASHMFDGLFENCTNMGTPSQDLFSRTEDDYYGTAAPKYGISGAPAPYVFANTFKNTNVNSFYPQWFSGLSGAPASHMFDSTFDGASNLYIYLDNNNNTSMFKNIVGAPAAYMFANTFRGTYMQGSPDGLFSGIRGAPAEGMFMGTFESTHISQIPEDLFAGVIGAPAAHMFDSTFAECQSLSDDYLSPALFVNISGTAAPYMFAGTFAGCNIGGNLPSMFAGITGSAAHMFEATFAGTNGLIGYIQPSMFAGITGTATDMMIDIFDESGIVTECPSGTTQYTTGFESWFDERVSCVPTAADFEVRAGIQTTPMPANTTFSFTMSARGTFYVDWGDGSAVETITRNNTTPTTYSHTYTESTDEGWKIAFGGVAIGYSTDDTTAAISFANNQYVAYPVNIGHLFPTLGTGNGNQPRFYRTFYNCTNMVGDIKVLLTWCSTKETVGGDGSSIISTGRMASNRKRVASSGAHSTTTATRSASLKRQRATNDAYHNDDYDACTGIFDGVYGQPVSHMFDGTFEGCTGLTGEIPNSLFVTISGTPVPYVFANTFKNCSGISGEIPKDLFGGLYGAPAAHMFESTFENDTNLTGTIPTSLFSSRSVSSTTGSVSSGSDNSGTVAAASNIKRTTMRGAVLRREGQTGGASNTISLTNGTFNGIEGAPAAYMFSKTFKGCANLTGAIPAGLFSGISGAPAEYMFEETFAGCTGIDTIPACLFGGISGAPAAGMYKGTFDGCNNAEWEYTPGATHNTGSVSSGTNIPANQEFASNLKRGASLTRGAVAGSTLGKITNATKKVNTLREAVMGGLTRGGIIRSAGLRSNTTTTDNANAMPSLFGQFTGAAAAHMFENTFRGCAKLSGYVPPKMFEGITGVATDMMTDEFDNSGIATSCPAGYSTATTGFESWWDGRVACEYVGQICVYEEGAANPYKCADGCGWASKLMMYNESWNEFGGFPGYPLMSESVTDHSINISNGTTTCYLPIAENADWGLHVKWNDKVWHAMFAQVDADENGTWGYCTGTYQDNYDGSCTTNSDCDWLYDGNYQPACYQGTCALYQSYGNCYYIMGDTSICQSDAQL